MSINLKNIFTLKKKKKKKKKKKEASKQYPVETITDADNADDQELLANISAQAESAV